MDNTSYNPLDNNGYPKIEVEDFVRATGGIKDNLFKGREFEAQTVTELSD